MDIVKLKNGSGAYVYPVSHTSAIKVDGEQKTLTNKLGEITLNFVKITGEDRQTILTFTQFNLTKRIENLNIQNGNNFTFTIESTDIADSDARISAYVGDTWNDSSKLLIKDKAVIGRTYTITADRDIDTIKVYLISGDDLGSGNVVCKVSTDGRFGEIIEILDNMSADQIAYDHSQSNLNADTVQEAIDEAYGVNSSVFDIEVDTTNILDPSFIDKSSNKYIGISTGFANPTTYNYYVTDYIPFTSEGIYINNFAGTGTMGWALYDSSKVFIIGGLTNAVEYQEGAAFIRVTLKGSEEDTWMLSRGTTVKDYVPFNAHIVSIKQSVKIPRIETLEDVANENNEFLSSAFDFEVDTTNILSPDLVDESSHKYININDGKAKNTTGNVYVTDFIPITSDGAYISGLAKGGVFGWALYDGDGEFISGASGKTSSIPYTEGAVFLRATLSIANRDKWMICNGTTPRSYVPYNYLRPIPKFDMPNDLLTATFGNRQFVILGDSSVTSDKWTGLFATFVGDYNSVVYNAAVGSQSWQHLQAQWDSLKANVTVDDPIIIIGAGPVGLENYIDAGSHTNQYGVYIDYSENKTVVNWTTDKVLQRCVADTSAKATYLDAGIEFMKGLLKEKPKAMIFLQNNWITMHDFMTTQNYDVVDYIARRRKLKEFYEVFADFFGCAIVDASRANIHGYIENYTLDNGATYPYRWATGDGTHINQAEGKERVFNMWVGTLMQYLMKV